MEGQAQNGVSTQKLYNCARVDNILEDNVNVAKKKKKWSLGGLFKRRRTKSSDTDSSSDVDEKKKSFLTRRSVSHHKGGSHKVVGKFETIIIPRSEPKQPPYKEPYDCLEKYDASPNMVKHRRNSTLSNGACDGGLSYSHEIAVPRRPDSLEIGKSNNNLLDAGSRRGERQKMKVRVMAMRDRLCDSTSSDECGDSSKTSNCSSLQRINAETRDSSSLNRRSRAARTDRYIRRHFRENEGVRCYSNSDPKLTSSKKISSPVGSSRNPWVEKVVYQQSSDYPMRYTARAQSANSSPMSSPLNRLRNFQCSSLPGSRSATTEHNRNMFEIPNVSQANVGNSNYNSHNSVYGPVISTQSCESLPKTPPPPPPRNPNRKVVPIDSCLINRPSSYAFDANTRSNEIAAYVKQTQPVGFRSDSHPNLKSKSEIELRKNNQQRQKSIIREVIRSDDTRNFGSESAKKYCADRSPRSRNPIQLIQKNELSPNETVVSTSPAANNVFSRNTLKSAHLVTQNGPLLLSRVDKIGIPVTKEPEPTTVISSRPLPNLSKSTPETSVRGRPLSVVSEKSDNELLELCSLDAKKTMKKPTPKDLEEALLELEEIYNSLKLSDEDLLDRADRRDMQSAIKMNPNFSRHSWNDLDEVGDDQVDYDRRVISSECLYYFPEDRYLFSPRLAASRRSAVPDAIADDMAYRKLHKKENQDPKSTSNVVSQSGSFLLMSPALSPPPLIDVPPVLPSVTNNEPDIMFDDVVFRNIRQANTLKILDPQPPFGIPLGPVSPAPNSDYLHAVPGEKYRSTFNPSRTPDVVKDDLAFRNLRKDVHGRPDIMKQYMVPSSADAKKRRAIRSLSANVVSLIGKHNNYGSDNEDALVDVNCNNLRRYDRCVSFNNLPDILEDYHCQKRKLLENCEECLDDRREHATDSVMKDKTLDLISGEARTLSKELRRKLRDLETVPLTNGLPEQVETGTINGPVEAQLMTAAEKDVFRGRVAVHKPITLSQFRIDIKEDVTAENGIREPVKLTSENHCNQTFRLKNLCQNLKWENIKAVCGSKQTVLCGGEYAEDDNGRNKLDNAENSSSGVSSTSDTPDSSRTCELNTVSNFHSGTYRAFPVDSPSPASPPACDDDGHVAKICVDDVNANKFSTIPDASETSPIEHSVSAKLGERRSLLNGKTIGDTDVTSNAGSCATSPPLTTKCSRIEIRLSTPEPTGTLFPIIPVLQSNLDVLVFAVIYFVACMHQVFFNTFSIFDIVLILISLTAYFTVHRR